MDLYKAYTRIKKMTLARSLVCTWCLEVIRYEFVFERKTSPRQVGRGII
jgi:hypothetical protein